MKKLTDRQKLTLIDGLCILYEDGPKTQEQAEKILDNMYRIAHPKNSCPHEDWEKETVELAKGLKEDIVDVWQNKTSLKKKGKLL